MPSAAAGIACAASLLGDILGGDREDTTGIVVPPDVTAALGAGRRLKVALLGYTAERRVAAFDAAGVRAAFAQGAGSSSGTN